MLTLPPLAVRMRPTSLGEVAGQSHLLRAGSPLVTLANPDAAARAATSVILWGPPGTGKTTLAQAIAYAANDGQKMIAVVAVTSVGVVPVTAIGIALLFAVGAAVIGGTSLFGGKGRVSNAIVGGAVIATIENGLRLLGQPAAVVSIVTGLVLLLAASVDALSRRRAPAGVA